MTFAPPRKHGTFQLCTRRRERKRQAALFSQAHLHHFRKQQYLLGVLASGKEALDAQDLRRKRIEVRTRVCCTTRQHAP